MLMLEMLLKEATMRQLSVREGGVWLWWLWLLLLVVGEHDDGGDGESGKCVTLYTREALTDPPPEQDKPASGENLDSGDAEREVYSRYRG